MLVICFVSFYKTLKSKELVKRWKTISSDEKAEWQADADAGKETYMQELAAYEKVNPTVKTANQHQRRRIYQLTVFAVKSKPMMSTNHLDMIVKNHLKYPVL